MNWGTRIVIFYSAFVVGILFLVIKSTYHSWDLVTEDYYGEELKYQTRIDDMTNTNRLENKPVIRISNADVVVNFPKELMAANPAGKVKFYKPSDKTGDFEQALQLDADGNQKLSIPAGKSGKYNAQLSWSSGDKAYYQEFYLFLP
ncbi:MAG: FixH family protein [Saprospiraceae bacterium]